MLYMHTYILACIHNTCRYIHTYIHTYIHNTCTYAYIIYAYILVMN